MAWMTVCKNLASAPAHLPVKLWSFLVLLVSGMEWVVSQFSVVED
jgi:hypothetical protein